LAVHAPINALPLVLERVGYAAGGVRIIEDLSLTVAAGAPTIVLGPNGAGKSVLLRLCHGLFEPSTGRIRTGNAPPTAERTALVFQRPVMLRRSALANVTFALARAGVAFARRRERGSELLARVGLAHLAARPARKLSGGEQQRVALARAWARAPQILFLDEPTANLDPAATRAVEEIVREIAAAGVKIVMATHDLGQARRLAGDVVFLHAGRLIEHTPAERFFRAPDSREATAFLQGELLV
jgi:tungstate transport system ATP-binding protein